MQPTHIIDVNDHNLADTLAQDVPVLLDFGAVWCPPCRAIDPHIKAVASKYADRLVVGKVDADSNPDASARFDVRSLPTLLLFKRGQVVGQIVGAVPRARIEALIERAL